MTKENSSLISKPLIRNEVKIGTPEFIVVSGIAGVIVAGGSHTLTTPIDVMKVRIQIDPGKYPYFTSALKTTWKEEGLRGLAKGWSPTLVGFGIQGFAKFGFYETFKKQYSDLFGRDFASKYDTTIRMLAASSAETIGTGLLSPFMAVKVRLQTCTDTPKDLVGALRYIYRKEGLKALFKGLPPLWMRQIPYTNSQFICFEWCSEFIYKKMLQKERHALSGRDQMAVSLTAGIIAGIACTIFSHPPDVILTKLYKNPNSTIMEVTRSLGFCGLWSGLLSRIYMIGTVACMQLFIVDLVKDAFHLERREQ